VRVTILFYYLIVGSHSQVYYDNFHNRLSVKAKHFFSQKFF